MQGGKAYVSSRHKSQIKGVLVGPKSGKDVVPDPEIDGEPWVELEDEEVGND